jgi:hypothetical protein
MSILLPATLRMIPRQRKTLRMLISGTSRDSRACHDMTGKRVFPASGFRNGSVNRLSTTLAQVGAINSIPARRLTYALRIIFRIFGDLAALTSYESSFGVQCFLIEPYRGAGL